MTAGQAGDDSLLRQRLVILVQVQHRNMQTSQRLADQFAAMACFRPSLAAHQRDAALLRLRLARPSGEQVTNRRIVEDPLRLAGVRDYRPGDSVRHIHWKSTARQGRLQTKVNLMAELGKIHRVVQRELGRDLDEVLLVVDATTGQNALSQGKIFQEAVPLTGIALTKLDGTAKGGIVLALASELELAVKLVGVGEQYEDLQDFDARAFVAALFGGGES